MDILIVDDDAAIRAVYKRALERAGYMVNTAENGLAAFAELQQHRYQVILCDLQMPFLKGYNLFEELRAGIPDMADRVIFVTGWVDRQDLAQFLSQTGRPFLQKPVDLKDLVAAVRTVAGAPG